jgi:hypothetical protein
VEDEVQEKEDEYGEDFSEEEVPEDEGEDDIISDNYENFDEDPMVKQQLENMKRHSSNQFEMA